MHDHDPDLIASLAEGSLGAEEARPAEESIAGCEECLAEVTAQRLALAVITAAPRPGLSMAESADLRRAVASGVGLSPAGEPGKARRPWLGLATAAAVVAALIAVAPVVNLLSTRSDADSATETTVGDTSRNLAATDAVPTTTAAAVAEAPVAEAPGAGDDLDAAVEEASGVTEFAGPLLPDSYIDFGSVADVESFLAEVIPGIDDRTSSRSLTDDEIDYYSNRFRLARDEKAVLGDCTTTGALAAVEDAESVVTIGTARFGEIEFVVVLVTRADGGAAAFAIEAATCEVLAQVDA